MEEEGEDCSEDMCTCRTSRYLMICTWTRVARLIIVALDVDKYRNILTIPFYEGGHILAPSCTSCINAVGSIAVHFATHSHSATRVEFRTLSARPAYEEWCAAELRVVPKVRLQRETSAAGVKRAQDAGTTEMDGKGTLPDLTGSGKAPMKGS